MKLTLSAATLTVVVCCANVSTSAGEPANAQEPAATAIHAAAADLLKVKKTVSGGKMDTLAPVSAEDFKALGFLQGCWGTTAEKGDKVSEDWHKQAGEVMLGISQTVSQAGSMREYEFIEIRFDRAASKITYTPWLNGRRLNTFTLDVSGKASSIRSAAFVDPNNASLKKIVYTAKGPDALNVRLEGSAPDGGIFDFNFDYIRENCTSRF